MLGRLSRIDVRLMPGADPTGAARAGAAGGVRAAAPTSRQRLSNVSRAYRVNLTVLALVALFTGAFLVFSVLALSVASASRSSRCSACSAHSAANAARWCRIGAAQPGRGSVLGLALGTALASLALRWLSGDLGGGFPGRRPRCSSASGRRFASAHRVVAAIAGGTVAGTRRCIWPRPRRQRAWRRQRRHRPCPGSGRPAFAAGTGCSPPARRFGAADRGRRRHCVLLAASPACRWWWTSRCAGSRRRNRR